MAPTWDVPVLFNTDITNCDIHGKFALFPDGTSLVKSDKDEC